MPKFIKVDEPKSKHDAVGTVRIKVILQSPNLQPGYPVQGNLKYEVELKQTTVGAVKAAIEQALFSNTHN